MTGRGCPPVARLIIFCESRCERGEESGTRTFARPHLRFARDDTGGQSPDALLTDPSRDYFKTALSLATTSGERLVSCWTTCSTSSPELGLSGSLACSASARNCGLAKVAASACRSAA